MAALCGQDACLHDIQSSGLDALLKPKDLQFFTKRVDTIFLQVLVEVVLFNMELDILVKSEMSLVTLIPEGLNLRHDPTPRGDNLLTAQKLGMKGPEGLTAIHGLVKNLAVSPPGGLAPDCMEDIKHHSQV